MVYFYSCYLISNCSYVVLFQMPVIKALAILKYCAASVNQEYGLKTDIADAIKIAAEEVCKPNCFSTPHPLYNTFAGIQIQQCVS